MAITPPDAPLDTRFERWLEELARAGVDAVQIRRKELGDRELLALALRTRDALAGTSVAILINGRVDVALAADLAGVHLPTPGLPTVDARRLLGGALLLGRSTHSLSEIERERRAGADYVTFGPVYATPSKAAHGTPKGIDGPDGLRAACAVGVPVLALGGITPERVAEVARAGAAGVAAIRACGDPASLGALAAAAWVAFGPPGRP